jgi:ubiquinone/menaquinone biosynthesis C-methylase UbiE
MAMITDDAGATDGTWIPEWDGAAYAANTGHHREHDGWFLEHFPIRPTDRLLDLGCGSGDFTRVLADLVPDGEVVGLDAQPSMLDAARVDARPNQSFVLGPVQDLGRLFPGPQADATFSAISSRSVLHWVPAADHPGVLAEAFRLLEPGGWLRIECGGAGNVITIVDTFDRIATGYGGPTAPWTFLDAGRSLELTERAGFELGADGYVRTVAQRRHFDRESLTGWLRSQAIEAYAEGIDPARRDAFRAEVVERVDEFARHDGTFDQTYVRLDLLVRKAA